MLAAILLAAVTAERLAELAIARRNTRDLLAQGARDVAPGHYRLIVLLHAAWLASLWAQGTGATVPPLWLVLFLALQALRLWVLATLGRRWTTRIIVLPGAPLVTSSPFRWLRHPNYAVVVGEIATLPLALGLPVTAAAFTVLNALVLAIRIRAEDTALAPMRQGVSGPLGLMHDLAARCRRGDRDRGSKVGGAASTSAHRRSATPARPLRARP